MSKSITGNRWDELLADEWQKPYYQELRTFLKEEYRKKDKYPIYPDGAVYPPAADIYNALRMTDYDDVKVVILGQDPYHEPGQAHGLAFSVPAGTPEPPSLVNILKELESDLGIVPSYGAGTDAAGAPGLLDPWAKQGVLLLNTVLTVRAHAAGSHRGRGWERFTDRVIELLARRERPLVFVLWGAHAQAKKEIIRRAEAEPITCRPVNTAETAAENAGRKAGSAGAAGSSGSERSAADTLPAAMRRHLVIEAPHPSPLSAYRGFFGGCYFSRCNFFLEDNGIEPVDWSL